MKILKNPSLSDKDMEWLVGSSLMESLMRNKLFIFFGDIEVPSYEALGLYDVANPIYIVEHDRALQIYFSDQQDLEEIEEKVALLKLEN